MDFELRSGFQVYALDTKLCCSLVIRSGSGGGWLGRWYFSWRAGAKVSEEGP